MICNKCLLDKPEKEFYRDKSHRDGIRKVCKECSKLASKERYYNNREHCLQTNYNWRNRNKYQYRIAGVLRFKNIMGGRNQLEIEDLKMIAIERLIKLKISHKITKKDSLQLYQKLLKADQTEAKKIINHIFSQQLQEFHYDTRFN